MMKKRQYALIYSRVSTQDQDYRRQIADMKAVIYSHGYKDDQIKVFAEKTSGYKDKNDRPELTKLLKLVDEKPTECCIYISEITRLGRTPIGTRQLIDKLTQDKVNIYIGVMHAFTLDDHGNRSMYTSIILQILLEIGNSEAETLKARSKSGLHYSAKVLGRAGGGVMLNYGYKRDSNKVLIVDKDESLVIQQIFELYKSGHGTKAISHILNDKRIPTRTNKTHKGKIIKGRVEKDGSNTKWSDKTIHDILRNTIYIGQRKFKGEIINAPAIISEDLFNECNAIMQGKTHRNYLTTYTYLLKDLCSCGVCANNYMAKYKPVAGGDKVYICTSRLKKGENCGNAGVNINLIESSIFSLLTSTPRILNYLTDSDDVKKEIETAINLNEKQLELLKGERKQRSQEKDRLLDLYLGNGLNKTQFKSKDEKLDKQLESLEERITNVTLDLSRRKKALKNIATEKSSLQTLKNAAKNRSHLEALFKQFINKVIINVIDGNLALATIYISIKGEVLLTPIKMLLDLKGVKKPSGTPKLYRFKTLYHMINEPVYKNGILMTDFDDLLEEFEKSVEWEEVDQVLKVMPTD